MKRWNVAIWVMVLLAPLSARVCAQSEPMTVDPETIQILGTLGKGALTSSLRLTAEEDLAGITLLISDLVDTATTGILCDPVPASAVTFIPGFQLDQLAKGQSVQVTLQVAPPSEAGIWSGTLSVRWQEPSPGELELPVALNVRNRPELSVAEPGRLKVAGVRGQTVRRTLVLQETANGVPATGLETIVQDLPSAKGDAVFPANNIQVEHPTTELEGGGRMTISVVIDLGDVPSGEYAGALLITDDYDNEVTVPIEISAKDRAWWPVLILVLGVALSRGVTTYRSRGRPRDRLILRIAAIRDRVSQETQSQDVLKGAVERILIQAEAAQASGQWDDANAVVERAEALVVRWRQERTEWIRQIDQVQMLGKRLKDSDSQAVTIQALRRQLNQIDLEEFETPEALEDVLTRAGIVLTRFEQMEERLRTMRAVLDDAQLPADDWRNWEAQVKHLQRRLDNTPMDDEEKAQGLADDISAASRKLKSDIEQYSAMDARKQALVGDAGEMVSQLGRFGSPLASVAVAANTALEYLKDVQDIVQATRWAENIWRGLWSAQYILPLATDGAESVAEAAQAMQQWLSDGNSYLQPADSFVAALEWHEKTLRTALQESGAQVVWPVRPPLPRGVAKGILTDLQTLEAEIGIEPFSREDIAGLPPPPSPPSAGCLSRLVRLVPSGTRKQVPRAADAARWRLRLFTAITYVVALGFLSWIGFNELYASSATFGADGAVDYFALLAWGFGVEATRSTAAEWVKGLVPAD